MVVISRLSSTSVGQHLPVINRSLVLVSIENLCKDIPFFFLGFSFFNVLF
ncbi:hypothetical protein IC575_016062 [Cucumis melo]